MINNTDREAQLLAPENLPLDLDDLGMVTQADLVMPGVYDTVLENPETGVGIEAYIALKNAPGLSAAAKKFGKTAPGYPELLVYSEGKTGNARYIVSYELFQYRILHSLPLPENDNIRSIAAIGAEMYPGYFGGYPVPFLTPWGCTTRNKIISNGLYWLETEQCQRGLAVAYPKYDDLSDGARGLAEQFDDGSARTNNQMPGYLFFRDADSCVPLFELISAMPKGQLLCEIDRVALMNAVYHYHSEYAAQHNLMEQTGRNDGLGWFLHTQGINTELKSAPERLLSLALKAGMEFIAF